VGSLDNIKRQKTKECDSGMQVRQITSDQSSLTRGGRKNICASLALRMPSVACFQTRLSDKGVIRSIIIKVCSTNISSLPTLFLDSIILADVSESIFKELNKLVKARNNFVHEEDYVKEWRRLRERVDFVMSELQKSSLKAHSNAQNTLNDWFKDVVKSMQEVEIKRTQERSKLYISDTHMFLNASGIISLNVHSENLDLKWLTKLKVQTNSPILEKLKNDSELEKENKRLKKELL